MCDGLTMAAAPLFLVAGGGGGHVLLTAFLLAASLLVSWSNAAVSYDHRSLVINGRRRILISGSIHYPRSTPEVPIAGSFPALPPAHMQPTSHGALFQSRGPQPLES